MTKKNRFPLIDVFTPSSARLWYRLHANGGDDLHPVGIETDEIGAPPGWWAMGDTDLDTIMGFSWSGHEVELSGRKVRLPWLQWALENGVAPGQPFLMCIDAPIGHRDYYGEYDEEWNLELIERQPLPLRVACKRWEHFWRNLERYNAMGAQYDREARDRVMRDTSSMHIARSTIGVGMNPERSVRLVLRSEHTLYNPFYIGGICSEWGNGHATTTSSKVTDDQLDANAMLELVRTACERNPYLSPSIIYKLPVKRW